MEGDSRATPVVAIPQSAVLEMLVVFTMCQTPAPEQSRLLTLLADTYERLSLSAEALLGCMSQSSERRMIDVFHAFDRLQIELIGQLKFQPLSVKYCVDCATGKRAQDHAAMWIASHCVAVRYMAVLRERLMALNNTLMFGGMSDSAADYAASFKGLDPNRARALCCEHSLAIGRLISEIDDHFEHDCAQQVSPR